MPEIGPTTRSSIIRKVHTVGEHTGTHHGLKVRIEKTLIQTAAKLTTLVTLSICIDRKWKSFPCANVFDAVETLNQLLNRRHIRNSSEQEELFPDA